MSGPLTLTASGWSLALAPATGGAIGSLTLNGRDVLRPALEAADVRGSSAYPLIPYANRIAGGAFEFGGRSYRLRPNFPGPHTLHGVAWRRSWVATRVGEATVDLHLIHNPTGDDAFDWPFAFTARQSFALTNMGLSLTMSATNTDAQPAPFGLGLHSFFPRHGGDRLTFRSGGAWTNGGDMLPGQRVQGGVWDFSDGRRVGEADLDNDFDHWDGAALIDDPQGHRRIRLAASNGFADLRVFTPAGRDYFAVEPVTHLADAIHRLEELGNGLVILQPGETLSGVITLSAEAPP